MSLFMKKNHWKVFGCVGVVLAAGAYTAVCFTGKLELIENLQLYSKILIGAGESIISGIIFSAVGTAQYYCARRCEQKKHEAEIRQRVELDDNSDAVTQSSSYKTIKAKLPKLTKAILEKKWADHVSTCINLIKDFTKASATGKISEELHQAYIQIAKDLRQNYADLSDEEYLEKLKQDGYSFDLPLNIITSVTPDPESEPQSSDVSSNESGDENRCTQALLP